jgi:predicted secreted protein
MIKRLLLSATVVSIIFSLSIVSAFAAERCSYSVQLKGVMLDANAFSEEGIMYLPLRATSEASGYRVEWLPKDRAVELKDDSSCIEISFDNASMCDGKHKIIDGKAYLSADLIHDLLGIVFAQSRTENTIFLYKVKENEKTIKVGETYNVILDGNPTTGYLWQYKIRDESIVQLDTESVSSDSKLTGAGSSFSWTFKALKPGGTKITFKYYRPWESEESALQIEDYYIKVEL